MQYMYRASSRMRSRRDLYHPSARSRKSSIIRGPSRSGHLNSNVIISRVTMPSPSSSAPSLVVRC
eukprot:scaffold12086_cov122-Isochrysis_galbana.AAC.3